MPGLNGYWGEWLDEPIHFGFGAEAEEVMNPDWAASALSSPLATAPDGGGRSCGTSVSVHHHPDYDDMFTQIFRKAIPLRYRLATSPLSFLAPGQRQFDRPVERIRSYEERETQSTTVRFTDSDLHLIECLQEKLGLGMIHVIRLAIRRLAESENLSPLPSTPQKRQSRA